MNGQSKVIADDASSFSLPFLLQVTCYGVAV